MINERHGKSGTPEYRAYCDAKSRCENKSHQHYPRYGARGIEFRFTSFAEFLEYVGERPNNSFSLDRLDNQGPYAQGNVRWALWWQQSEWQKEEEFRWPFVK